MSCAPPPHRVALVGSSLARDARASSGERAGGAWRVWRGRRARMCFRSGCVCVPPVARLWGPRRARGVRAEARVGQRAHVAREGGQEAEARGPRTARGVARKGRAAGRGLGLR